MGHHRGEGVLRQESCGGEEARQDHGCSGPASRATHLVYARTGTPLSATRPPACPGFPSEQFSLQVRCSRGGIRWSQTERTSCQSLETRPAQFHVDVPQEARRSGSPWGIRFSLLENTGPAALSRPGTPVVGLGSLGEDRLVADFGGISHATARFGSGSLG